MSQKSMLCIILLYGPALQTTFKQQKNPING